jgi:hypothetical protein
VNIESGLVLEKNFTVVSTVAFVVLQPVVATPALTTDKHRMNPLTTEQFIATSY